ncbi:MAG: methyltransferase domain-containing protein [Gemmataceae bacterium]
MASAVLTTSTLLRSSMCKQADLESPEFRALAARLKISATGMHRKVWEFCFIARALAERGVLREGARGLVFGVGQEPLVAYFASLGCTIVATDMAPDEAAAAGWMESNQHAVGLSVLNKNGLCPPEVFAKRVSFRFVDMNAIPADLRDFDFVWSACSLEHVGSIRHGERFILEAMKCLRPGGVAVQTTELNLSSNRHTLDNAWTVLFRERDIERIARRLSLRGHHIDLDLTRGEQPADLHVDMPPYKQRPHLRLQLEGYTTTSVGLIIQKGATDPSGSIAWQDGWLCMDPLLIRSALDRRWSAFKRRITWVTRPVKALLRPIKRLLVPRRDS